MITFSIGILSHDVADVNWHGLNIQSGFIRFVSGLESMSNDQKQISVDFLFGAARIVLFLCFINNTAYSVLKVHIFDG